MGERMKVPKNCKCNGCCLAKRAWRAVNQKNGGPLTKRGRLTRRGEEVWKALRKGMNKNKKT